MSHHALLKDLRCYWRQCAAGLSQGFKLLAMFRKGFGHWQGWFACPRQGFGHSRGSSKGFALSGTPSPNIQEGSYFWQTFAKGFALLRTCWPKPRKGSHFRRGFGKGLHSHLRIAQGSHFGLYLQRVRTSGHMLAKILKGFALVAAHLQTIPRVHTFLQILARLVKGSRFR